ncbi:MAG TPA: MCE family protein [Marmoricola sp.]|nr:MCE family protein [Marmoricola sp.]
MRLSEDRRLAAIGLAGLSVLALAVLIALNLGNLPLINGGKEMTLQFADAGSIKPGDPVLVSGTPVGKVTSVGLDGTHVDVRVRVSDHNAELGSQTTAAIVTRTVLGSAAIVLKPAGPGQLAWDATIPLSRTSSPYDVTAALSQLTTTTSEIDIPQLQRALNTISSTFSDTPEVLKEAVRGMSRVSASIASRDSQLASLFHSSASVSGVLAARNAEVAQLLKDGAGLLSQLNARKQVVEQLFVQVTAVSGQIRHVIASSGARLQPALTEVNRVTDLLNRNKKKLQQAIEGLNGYIAGLGDAVSSGPYFDGYIVNLVDPGSLAPVLSGLLAGSNGGGR